MDRRFLGPLSAFTLALACVLPPCAAPAQQAPFDLDVLISLTGPGGNAGRASQKSMLVFQGLVNAQGGIRDRPLRLVFHDDRTNPQTAVQLVRGIVARHPAAIVGPASATICNAIAPLVANGPVDYCLAATIAPSKGSYVFANGASQADLIGSLVRYYRDRGIKRIAAVTTTDATGKDADQGLATAFAVPENKQAGLVLVAREHVAANALDVRGQVARMKAAAPGAVVCWTTGAAFGTFLRSWQQTGLDVPVGTSPVNLTRAQMAQYRSLLPHQLYFSGAPFPVGIGQNLGARALVDEYRNAMQRAGIAVDYPTGLAWDPLSIVVDALRHIGPDAGPAPIRDYIDGLRGFASLDGNVDFVQVPQRGIDQSNLIVMQWDAQRNDWVAATRVGGGLLR